MCSSYLIENTTRWMEKYSFSFEMMGKSGGVEKGGTSVIRAQMLQETGGEMGEEVQENDGSRGISTYGIMGWPSNPKSGKS